MSGVKKVKGVEQTIPANKLKRFLAYLIDVSVLNIVLILPFQEYLGGYTNSNFLIYTGDNNLFLLTIIVVLITLFYFAFLEWKIGQTLGKLITKIETVSLDRKKLTFNQALLRNITKPFSIVLLIDVMYMFFKKGRQRLFEVFSRTAVIERSEVLK